MYTYIALARTPWKVGIKASAIEIPNIDNATRSNHMLLKISSVPICFRKKV